jgi:hypothetical protein
MRNKYFKLFSCCIPVKGAVRFVIIDLQRQDLFFINEGTYEILTQQTQKKKDEIYNSYSFELHERLNEIFSFLVENEIGFWTDEPEKFPNLELHWEFPAKITNAIIEVIENSDFNHEIEELDNLGCRFLEIRTNHLTKKNMAQPLNWADD